jgi:hypothetical protein
MGSATSQIKVFVLYLSGHNSMETKATAAIEIGQVVYFKDLATIGSFALSRRNGCFRDKTWRCFNSYDFDVGTDVASVHKAAARRRLSLPLVS